MNLVEGLNKEIERCQELLIAYHDIGPPGAFASVMIKSEIKEGLDSLVSGDVVRMMKAYESLKGCK